MPRTKMVKARTKPKPNSGGSNLQEKLLTFRNKKDAYKCRIEKKYESIWMDFENKFDMSVAVIDAALLDKTMAELKVLEEKENTTPNAPNGLKGLTSTVKKFQLSHREEIVKTVETKKKPSSTSSQDDGYVTESSTKEQISRPATRMSRRRSRSAAPALSDTASGKSTTSRTTTRKRSSTFDRQKPMPAFKVPRSGSQYRTPAYKGPNQFPAITPKIAPNTPMALLRRPRQGEMVMSMSGSPLLVSQMQSEDKANCNIPLFDGTTLCMLPEKFRESTAQIPESLLDPAVISQLETLQRNINCIVKTAKKNS